MARIIQDEDAPAAGHNSSPAGFASGELRAFVERIERLEEERQVIKGDITDVYGEAKGFGFDTRTIRQVVRLRKQDKAAREEQEALLDLYLSALGMTFGGDED
jgi:uncharacterized protein (UPF0335 family)